MTCPKNLHLVQMHQKMSRTPDIPTAYAGLLIYRCGLWDD
jgi:hypothetical protein